MKSRRDEGSATKYGIDPRDGRARSRLIQIAVTIAGCTLAAVLIAALVR